MSLNTYRAAARFRHRIHAHVAQPQYRNAYYLLLSNVTGAVTGVLFWLLLVRVAHLSPAEIGVGYGIVATGTIIGLVAKGGLDTALIRTVPGASKQDALNLLRFGASVGTGVAAVLVAAMVVLSKATSTVIQLSSFQWMLVAAIGALLVITWLQDAYFLAEGDARFSFQRNLVLSGSRLLLPLPVVIWALPDPVALTWGFALAASALAALAWSRGPDRPGRTVPRREFLTSAARNVTGNAAEFLPGLLLAPIALAIQGPEAAAYIGIAWTAASLLFLASAAMSRSALAQMIRDGPSMHRAALGRGARQQFMLLVPAALVAMLLAGPALAIFGPDYAAEATTPFFILVASTLFVAPTYLYLASLRARELSTPLIVLPAALVVALVVVVPIFNSRWGLVGIAAAWLAVNAPFGLWSAYALTKPNPEADALV